MVNQNNVKNFYSKKILMDDIPYNLQSMADIIGVDNFLEVCKLYGGKSVYTPVYKKVIMENRNREIARLYNGKNIDALRNRYNMSCQQVKCVLKREGVI